MKTYKVHLIRHGMTEGNMKGQYVGITDLPVTTNGIIELAQLKKSGIYPKAGLVFSSPLLRARQTAKILYPEQECIVIEKFKEIDFGDFEGKTTAELSGREDYKAWVEGSLDAPPHGESGRAFAERLCIGLREVVLQMMEQDVTSASAILHGGAIMMLLSATALPRQKMLEWACGNGRGYTVRITPSLYQSSGVIEVIAEIPDGEAKVIHGAQKEILS